VTAPAARYDLKELCREADVTARTVRYYIQQGLLRSPGSPGPGAKYDDGHLKRLFLIKRLQKEHLPLAEIRKKLNSLSEKEVEQLLRREARGRKTTAVEYIRGVLKGGRSSRTSTSAGTAKKLGSGKKGTATANSTGFREYSQWERVQIDPDVELHVRRPLSRDQRRKLDRLLAEAQLIFEDI